MMDINYNEFANKLEKQYAVEKIGSLMSPLKPLMIFFKLIQKGGTLMRSSKIIIAISRFSSWDL